MEAIKNFLKNLFGLNKPKRLHVKNVKVGDIITIEWSRISGGIGKLKCLNNDPKTKMILLEVEWGNYKEAKCAKTELVLLNYKDYQLRNFHVLNELQHNESDIIKSLKQQLNEAVENDEFELASDIKKKIDELTKKNSK